MYTKNSTEIIVGWRTNFYKKEIYTNTKTLPVKGGFLLNFT